MNNLHIRRGLALFLALIMCIGMLPISALAEGVEPEPTSAAAEAAPEPAPAPAPEPDPAPAPAPVPDPEPAPAPIPAPQPEPEPAPTNEMPMIQQEETPAASTSGDNNDAPADDTADSVSNDAQEVVIADQESYGEKLDAQLADDDTSYAEGEENAETLAAENGEGDPYVEVEDGVDDARHLFLVKGHAEG